MARTLGTLPTGGLVLATISPMTRILHRRLLVLVAILTWTTESTAQSPPAPRRLFPIVVNGLHGFIDSTGRVVIAPRFDDTFSFAEGLAPVRLGRKWGYIDTTGTFVIEPRFDYAWPFVEHLAWVQIGRRRGCIDRTGRLVIEPRFGAATNFVDGRAQVMMGRVFGYIDRTGKLVIQREHPGEIGERLDFSQGLAAVRVRGQWGYIDTTGAMVIAPQFRSAARLPSRLGSLRFSEGRASVPLGAQWGYIDRTGRVVIPGRFDDASGFHEGLAAVLVGDRYGYIDTTGAMVIAPQFAFAANFSEGLAAVRDSARRRGYVDRSGKFVLPPQWQDAAQFSGGLARVRTDANDEWDYIDRTGRYVWRVSAAAVTAAAARVEPVPRVEPADTTPLEGTGSFLDRVAAVVDRAEAAEAGRPVDRAQAQIMRDAAKAGTHLVAYLDSQPNDVRAVILSVRLARFQEVARPLVTQRGDTLPTFASLVAEFAPHHAALNRALNLEPSNAEVLFWKARLYGRGHDWMQMLYGVSDPPPAEAAQSRIYEDSAVHYGRRAVALAPDRVPYREALAVYLILSGQEQEAATVLQPVAAGRHPMSLLLSDWQAIPVPTGAVPLREQAQGLARMWAMDGALQGFPFLRARMYVVVTSADSVQAFYRRHWPGFRLFLLESEENAGARMRSYSQHLTWRDGRVVPASAKDKVPDEPTGGMAVVLIEITNPPAEVRQNFPVPLGSVFCTLGFINLRRFDGR